MNSGLPDGTGVKTLVVNGTSLFIGTYRGIWKFPLDRISSSNNK
ncbi:MAG: hypothetical protein WBV81_14145 [Ignavibacteriaceae bacterium]